MRSNSGNLLDLGLVLKRITPIIFIEGEMKWFLDCGFYGWLLMHRK